MTPHAAVAEGVCLAVTALISLIYLNNCELPADSAPRVPSIRRTDTRGNVVSLVCEAGGSETPLLSSAETEVCLPGAGPPLSR